MPRHSSAELRLFGASLAVLALVAPSLTTRALGGGSVSLAALDTATTQNFDSLASAAGTAHKALPAGWFLNETGTSARNNDAYAVSTGSDNAGDVYSFGTTGAADRAFGTLRSGTLVPIIGGAFTNNTGATLSSLDVSYTGEEWRLGAAGRSDQLDFQYSLDATSLTTGTWTDVDPLDFATPAAGTTGTAGARDGNNASFKSSVSSTISGLAAPPGATIWIRWTDLDVSGSDDGLAVDDFSITPHGEATTSVSVNDVSVSEGDSGTITATFTVTVSTSAHGGVTFDIATADNSATVADNDYVAKSLTGQTIPAGQQTYAFTVLVNGDTALELDETFFVNVTNVAGATLADGQAIGTITNDDAAPAADVVISQVYGGGGNSGATLTNDFIELFNRGATPVNLAGWSVQYSSPGGTGTWSTTPLNGTIQPGRYYLVQEAAGAGGTTGLPTPDAIGSIAVGSTAGKVLLRTTIGAISGACTAGSTIVDIVGYDATATCYEGAPTAATVNTTAALRKRGGCIDTNNNADDFSIGSPSPRNSATPARTCEFTSLPIPAIQGTGLTTPWLGQDVITTGIVTGRKTNGFFMQAADADGNPDTSEGLFVFTSTAPGVNVGDGVMVKGTASEYFDLTQVESTLAGDVTVTSTGNTLPASVELTTSMLSPSGTATQLERFEGMRLHAATLVSVAPTDSFGETYTVLGGVTRPMREPGIERSFPVPPDPNTGLPDCCIPRFDENPERIVIDSDGLAGATRISVTSNVTFTNVTGPLDYTFSAYKLLPETAPTTTGNMSPVPVPQRGANEFTVGGFNIENFANNNMQRKKAALGIRTLMRYPDVLGVIEIKDLASLQALATEINDSAVAAGDPDPMYEAHLVPASPGATQNVGFLVSTARVRIDSVTQELAAETFVDPVNGLSETLHDRPPLVLRATVNPLSPNAGQIIVVVNHLRSFIDIELVGGDGPRVRAKRTAQAESTAALFQQLQGDNPTTPVISVGDYNAYQFSDGYTDPMAILKGMPTPGDQVVVGDSPDLVNPNFINLTDSLPAGERYSFIFEGTPQALDHVLLNTVAQSVFQRYAVARSNSDFPETTEITGDATRPERSSDHDMPVAYFAFPGTPVVTLNGGATLTVEAFTSFTDPGATAHDDTGALPVTTSGSVNVMVPGDYTLTYTASNLFHTTTLTRTVRVVDSTPPAISGFAVTPDTLGPPNHKLVNVAALYSVTDASDSATCTLAAVSNEPADGLGDGHTAQDTVLINNHTLQLRAERSGRGDGRIYTVTVTCTDPSGNVSTASAAVRVGK